MAVEFLSDNQASAHGRFPSGFARGELELYFSSTTWTGAWWKPSGGRTTGSGSHCS